MICHSSQASSTLKPSAPAPPSSSSGVGVAADEGGTMVNTQTLTSNLGTMVINEDEDDTMKRKITLHVKTFTKLSQMDKVKNPRWGCGFHS